MSAVLSWVGKREDSDMDGTWKEPPTPEARAQSREEQLEEWWLRRRRRAWRSYPTLKVRNGGGKEIPLIQGEEQRRCFAGAAVKRYPQIQGKRNPSKMVGVARGHQRADTLKSYSQKTSQSNHTRTTALPNSMKLSHVVYWRREWQNTSGFLP